MNKTVILPALFIIFSLTGCMQSRVQDGTSDTIKISDFRAGLIEFDSNKKPRIYEEGNVFTFEVNGSCIAAGEEKSCQWRGFEFNYQSNYKVNKFNCTNISSRVQNFGYPDRLVAKNSKVHKWQFTLNGYEGHYIRPQYTTGVSKIPLNMKFSCTVRGKEVLRWEITLIPPSP